ncbi:MAG TPA: FtsX-like permease family protein, partial [Pseudonocardia sp.]|nr:FtsX-like permease family protein [Pseudonocardia sp.]
MNSTGRIWWYGLLRRRGGRLAAAAAGVGIAVALLASLGAFLVSAQASMTARAVARVPVDWQVQVHPGADPAAVLDAVRTTPGSQRSLPVGFGRADGLSATTGATTQTTGAATIVGLPAGYRDAFPGELRTLAGAAEGVLLAQQTAANLAVVPGDTVGISLLGGVATSVRVDGVVELPAADSLFQKVGALAGSQPSAPPDNVLLLPEQRWQDIFAPLSSAAAAPDQVTTQVHVARTHDLPPDPAAAYTAVTGAAHNFEARTGGAAVVGHNLGAALDAARGDAAYARILFLFLGLPGAVLAGLLTAAVVGAGAPRRRREQALLRARGATGPQLLRLAAVEAATVGIAGCVLGLVAAGLIGRLAFGTDLFGTGTLGRTPEAVLWIGAATALGLAIACLTVLLPAWRDQRAMTVAAAGVAGPGRPGGLPRWARLGVDLVLLALAAGVFWQAGQDNYTLVFAPEGVPTIAVSYWAFAGPALLWAGAGLLGWRLAELALIRGRSLLARLLKPLTGNLAGTVASTLARRRRPIARSIVLLAMALA